MKYSQIFRYTLELDKDEYEAAWVKPYAGPISKVKGLISKTWMVDFGKGEFASFYLWESKESMDEFMNSDIVAKVSKEPFLKDLEITALPVSDGASRITRGIK